MVALKDCDLVKTDQAIFYLGPSTIEYSEGYLELDAYSSLKIHNRVGSIEKLTQYEGSCVMILFDNEKGTNYLLRPKDELVIKPEGVWHIHANPFNQRSITYWHFNGDIREVIDNIRKSGN